MKSWLSNQAINHPVRTLVLMLVLTFVIGMGAKWIIIDDDIMKMIPDTMESRQSWDAILDEFGSHEMIFIAMGEQDRSIYNESLLAKIYLLSSELQAIPEVDDVISISTIDRMDSDDGFINISDLQPSADLQPDELSEIKSYLDRHPDMKVRLVSKNGDYANIVVIPVAGVDNNTFRNVVVKALEPFRGQFEMHIGGHAYLTGTIPVLIRDDVMKLMRVGILIMTLILLVNLRSFPAVGMVFSVILLSLAAMMGSIGWLTLFTGADSFHFSMLNTSMPIILLTIANSDGVHILTKFFKELRISGHKIEAVRSTMRTLRQPVFLTSLTTVAAFLTLISSPIEQMVGFGVCISVGIIWAWLLSVTFLPALITLKKWNLTSKAVSRTSILENLVDNFGNLVTHYPKSVLGGGVLIVVIGLVGLQYLKVEANIVTFFKPGTEMRDSIEFIDRELTGTMDLEMRVEGDLKDPEVLHQMDDIQNFLEQNPAVSTTISIVDIIKQMHRTVMDDDPHYESVPDSREKVNNLFTLYAMSGDPDDFSSMVDYDYQSGVITALMKNISTTEILKFIKSIRHFLKEHTDDRLHLTVTGMVVILKDMVHLIIQSSFISIISSIVIIFLILWIAFRRAMWGLLSVIPLTAAVILNFGFMGLAGIYISHITALLSSIIIGVGVDFAIHYVSQFRALMSNGITPDKISQEAINDVGYPIILDAASNMGFGALLFSFFVPIQYIGGLMVFAMISTSIGTLTLLAALAELMKSKLFTLNVST